MNNNQLKKVIEIKDIKQLKKYIEIQIKNNFFKTKEDLYKYLMQLKQNQYSHILTEKDIEYLLKVYDTVNTRQESPLDMINYSNRKFNEQNYIVSEEEDRMLKTNGNSTEFIEEFKQTQNQILAYNKDGMYNAKEVFNKLANTQKEEVTLLPIHEAIARDDIELEMLQKISFFITKMKVNPYEYRIDIQNGIFYNKETNQTYEVRKNEKTGQFEIYSSGEIKYENTNNIENESEIIENDHTEEKEYEESKAKVKVRKLEQRRYNNAAFTKITFLVINIISFIIISISIAVILKNK